MLVLVDHATQERVDVETVVFSPTASGALCCEQASFPILDAAVCETSFSGALMVTAFVGKIDVIEIAVGDAILTDATTKIVQFVDEGSILALRCAFSENLCIFSSPLCQLLVQFLCHVHAFLCVKNVPFLEPEK